MGVAPGTIQRGALGVHVTGMLQAAHQGRPIGYMRLKESFLKGEAIAQGGVLLYRAMSP